ncbi:MAG TPA: imelysin family protein [Candidatus Kapabacteria bacterium]
MKLLRLTIPSVFLLYFLGCTPENAPYVPWTPAETQQVNDNIANNVILPLIFEVDIKVSSLNYYIGKFLSDRDAVALDSARIAWRTAHEWWSESQAMFLGPARNSNLSALIDSFPVVVADVEQVLATYPLINQDLIVGFSGSLKGFHALEYLLFGIDGNKKASDFTGKERDYIAAVAHEMERLTQSLRYSWDPVRENYVGQITNPGQSGGAYATDKDAMRDLIDAMIFICNDLAERKIGKPLDMNADTLEESRFSSNSTNDYYSNILGLKYMYQGGKEPNSYGMSGLVFARSGITLDTEVFNKISNAENAISVLTPNFATSLSAKPNDVENARNAVRALKTILETQVRPLVLQ